MTPGVMRLEEEGDELDGVIGSQLPPHPSKVPWWEKGSSPIVDSLHLSCPVTSYNVHFAKYCRGRKQVMQLIHRLVWKEVFKEYKDFFLKFCFFRCG